MISEMQLTAKKQTPRPLFIWRQSTKNFENLENNKQINKQNKTKQNKTKQQLHLHGKNTKTQLGGQQYLKKERMKKKKETEKCKRHNKHITKNEWCIVLSFTQVI